MRKMEAVDTGKKNRKGESIIKPKAIHDYNQKMGGVSKNVIINRNLLMHQKSKEVIFQCFYYLQEKYS